MTEQLREFEGITGSLDEYCHPDTGAALNHKGFVDSNLLVLEKI